MPFPVIIAPRRDLQEAPELAALETPWHDLMTTDVDLARSFYTKLFGWKLRPLEFPPLGVTLRIESGGADLGALVSLPSSAGLRSHRMPYVQVDNVTGLDEGSLLRGEESCARVTSVEDLSSTFPFDLNGLRNLRIEREDAVVAACVIERRCCP